MCFAVITGLCPYEATFAYGATFKLVYRHFWLRSSSVACVLAILCSSLTAFSLSSLLLGECFYFFSDFALIPSFSG